MDTPDYQETTIAGTSWKRIGRVIVDNIRNVTPSLIMVEEKVTSIGDSEIIQVTDTLGCQFDASDPDDLLLYELLNKRYVKLRDIRDARLEAEPEVTP